MKDYFVVVNGLIVAEFDTFQEALEECGKHPPVSYLCTLNYTFIVPKQRGQDHGKDRDSSSQSILP